MPVTLFISACDFAYCVYCCFVFLCCLLFVVFMLSSVCCFHVVFCLLFSYVTVQQ